MNDQNNFCRVFEMPTDYPREFCFGGGHAITMKLVDWFQPIPTHAFEEFANSQWEEFKPRLIEFCKDKNYVKPGKRYILVTEFGESLTFNG